MFIYLLLRSNSLEGDERIVYQCIKAADNKGADCF
jgi:hypothetical protein